MATEKVIQYFNQDAMAADAWHGKYQVKDQNSNPVEETPTEMHRRLATEFGRVEYSYLPKEIQVSETDFNSLSAFGKNLFLKRLHQSEQDVIDEVFSYFDKFGYIVPQGSIMANLGNPYVIGSLSNCFVIPSPRDSYGGILKTDQELVQLMKRRGGVGTTLDRLRPVNATVTNAAKTSTGVPSFAERFSNSTREVGQEGRRGALMLLLAVMHPDIFRFVTMKADRTKVTGANISVMFTNEFMQLVDTDEDFICRFPVDLEITKPMKIAAESKEYNQMFLYESTRRGNTYLMKIKPKELFDVFVEMAWDNAEPGAAFIDRIQDYTPDGVYARYRPTKCNPCGEIWMGDYDACRLIAQNFFSCVGDPFKDSSYIDYKKLYEVSYMQQRLGDNLIDLEVEYIQRIIDKIMADPIEDEDEEETKRVELRLWRKILETTRDGRRTGNGFTALGDMLAAVGYKYDSPDAMELVEQVMCKKFEAELDCTIDMAILRGPFEGWDRHAEFTFDEDMFVTDGNNSFFEMIRMDWPLQAVTMAQYGRRNVSWSTVAPTGTVSVMTQTTSGLEPLFKAYYIRRKKINPSDKSSRVDFTDDMGDCWQEYPILHPKFREWIKVKMTDSITVDGLSFQRRDVNEPLLDEMIDGLDKDSIQNLFKESPWFGSEADDISWEKRVELQSIIQKYTTNAISSTINLPRDVDRKVVHDIYIQAWKKGLKGVTVYRDGSRTGVLVTESSTKLTNCDEFGYTDALKRPTELDADYYFLKSSGKHYGVFVGTLNNNPYEVFVCENPMAEFDHKGTIIKEGSGQYHFKSLNYENKNLQLTSDYPEEKMLTRWVSLLLRHGANPKHIISQVDKSEVTVASFAKVITRVLKKYLVDESIGEICTNCGEKTMIYQEGCKTCSSCGHSKC